MRQRLVKGARSNAFDIVKAVGVTLPGVEAATKYDGSPMLKAGGVFVAGVASHQSAEPDTLVIRSPIDERDRLIEDAPETYYLTDYYRAYPLVLVRLSHVNTDALRDLLSVSRRLALEKATPARASRRSPGEDGR